jgi:predicted dehydrogenase
MFEFESGAQGVVTGSYVSPKSFWLRLYGTEANLQYETDMNIWPQADKMDPATTLTLQRKSERASVEFASRDMLTEELEEFAACVRGETMPETGATEALAALALIQGALQSHERGRPETTEDI